MEKIKILGAGEHNLKNIDVEIPRNKLVVFTGLSGSGKSSLAFDTIYAEGHRRYVESLSAYARQFLGKMNKPKVDYIEGLSPTISIDQKTSSRNPRSTVGTVTEIYDYLRLMYARIGVPYCPHCGKEITKQTVQEVVDKILTIEEGTKAQILAPVIRGKKGQHEEILFDIKKQGFIRVRIDGEIMEIDDVKPLEKNVKHTIDVVIDRIKIKKDDQKRISDSAELAFKVSGGLMLLSYGDTELCFSENLACPDCNFSYEEISPRGFSFNSPYGACPKCDGLGKVQEVDPNAVVAQKLSIEEGAIYLVSKSRYYHAILMSFCKKHSIPTNVPFAKLTKEQKKLVLYGDNDILKFDYTNLMGETNKHTKGFRGAIELIKEKHMETDDYDKVSDVFTFVTCPECNGARLKKEALSIKIDGKSINDVASMSITNCLNFFKTLTLNNYQQQVSKQIVKEIRARLEFLDNVGLSYLTLARSAASLSGGESQRIRLATQIGSGLTGVLYVLDEPSIGLHQRDNAKLLNSLVKLRDLGNSLIVVEHDEDTIRTADFILDIGPKAGIHGGEIVAKGTLEDILKADSLTADYLSGRRTIAVPDSRRKSENFITIKNASENNLKNIDVSIPLNVFVGITGVSGSGKSTLINEILYKKAATDLYRKAREIGKHDEILGLENIDKVISVDQSPIGRTPRSNPATYTGIFDVIRKIFSEVPEARSRGYSQGRFSFNVKGGRCEACGGDGVVKIEMHFLPDVYVTCDICKGKRYERETLEIKYHGKNIHEVLDMTVEDAHEFFDAIPQIKNKLKTLIDVGLGYIKLGQPANTLSGGESQRVKLAAELAKKGTGKTLYILDEPTTGLHFHDVHNLLLVLQKLVDKGNTVLVIEHNLDMIKSFDYIIDMGPEGGDNGGIVVACGTPEEVAQCEESYTGQYLKQILS